MPDVVDLKPRLSGEAAAAAVVRAARIKDPAANLPASRPEMLGVGAICLRRWVVCACYLILSLLLQNS